MQLSSVPQATDGVNSVYDVGSQVGMIQGSSQLRRCPIPLFRASCLIPESDSRWALGGWDTGNPVHPFTVNTINRLSSPKIYLCERGNARVKKTFCPTEGIAFHYLNVKCCETKWLARFCRYTFFTFFAGPMVPHTIYTDSLCCKTSTRDTRPL